MFLAFFALRRVVDDHELGDINVSLLTVQLHCAFVYFKISFLMLEQSLCELTSLFGYHNEIDTIPDESEPFLTFILVKQSVILCTVNPSWIAGA